MPADLPATSPDATGRSSTVPARRSVRLGRHRPACWRKVFNVAYKFVGTDRAEDLTQDIFLKIFKSLDTFDRRANFQPG